MSRRDKEEGHKDRISIDEEDLAGMYQTRGGRHTPTVDESAILTIKNPPPSGMTPMKLFLTLVIALPLAATLAYVGIDVYEKRTTPTPVPTAAPTPTPEPTRDPAVVALEKKVKEQEGRLAKQAAEIKKQEAVIATLSKAPPKPTPRPTSKPTPKPEEPFNLFNEKVKVLNLVGIDLDDPVTPDIFDNVIRSSTMKKVIASLDRILDHSGDPGVDEDFIANVVRAKGYAKDRLKKLK